MAGTLTPTPFQTVLDTDGVAVSGALIYTYVGGTTTAAATYTTSALSVANTNPIVADAAGRFVAYLPAGGNFKFLYKTAAGATIEEQDNILSVPGAAVNLDIEGTVGEAVTAGQVCYLSTGAEATPLTAGLWYLTDADFAPTSTTCQSIGVAVSAIAINTAGTIRLAGTATMATAVVVGSTYYVSATAGAITATAPALSRTVGVALTTSTLLLAAVTAVVTPAGSNTQVQFNDSGVLGGDSGFTFVKATDAVAIAGPTTVGGTLGVTGLITSTGGITGGASSHTTGAFSSTVTGGTYNSQTISSAANFTGSLGVAGLLTVSGFGTHRFNGSGTGNNGILVENSTAGVGNFVSFELNPNSGSLGLRANSSTFTTSGINVANGATIEANANLGGGLSIAATNASGAIRFYSGGTTEWMRLTTAGILAIGTTTAYSEGGRTGVISVGFATANSWGIYLNDTSSAASAQFAIFGLGAGTGTSGIGSITRNGSTSAVLYNLTSDSRLKHDRGLAIDLSGLRALRVHDFTWINDPTQALDRNVFAQEAYTAIGRGITPGDDDLVTITKPWMVDRTSFIPDLIVGWQQHDARLAAMEAKLLAAGV